MSVLARVAHDMRVAQMPTGDRAYQGLCDAAADGTEITLTNYELVLAVSRAVWQEEMATAQLGLSELELRTERKAA